MMFAPSRSRLAALCANPSSLPSSPIITLPSFLVPALAAPPAAAATCRRAFSASAVRPSKLGRTPITIPEGVELKLGEPYVIHDCTTYKQTPRRKLTVAGPLGSLDVNVPMFIKVDYDTGARRLTLAIEDKEVKQQREMWGTTWAYIQRHITGVSEGHTAVLRLVGIGYRASIDKRPDLETYPGQDFVCLRLGYSHPVDLGVPKGMKAAAPQPTRILLEGIDREELMQFAADIRRWRVPEPYKGKGIFVNDETIKLKAKKIK